MTTKHTKGPWSVSQTGKYVRLCIPGTVLNICKMEINGDEEANARLIAAAPDLLEACRATLEAQAAHRWHVNSHEADCFSEIKAAIAKATAL